MQSLIPAVGSRHLKSPCYVLIIHLGPTSTAQVLKESLTDCLALFFSCFLGLYSVSCLWKFSDTHSWRHASSFISLHPPSPFWAFLEDEFKLTGWQLYSTSLFSTLCMLLPITTKEALSACSILSGNASTSANTFAGISRGPRSHKGYGGRNAIPGYDT